MSFRLQIGNVFPNWSTYEKKGVLDVANPMSSGTDFTHLDGSGISVQIADFHFSIRDLTIGPEMREFGSSVG